MGPILRHDNGNADATTIKEAVCQKDDEDVQYEMDLETYENVFRRDPYAYVGCSAADTELDVTLIFGPYDADDETASPSSSTNTCNTGTAGCEEETDTCKPILRAAGSIAGRILATGNQSPPEKPPEFADMPVQTRVATTAVQVLAAATEAAIKTTIAAPTNNGPEQSAVKVLHAASSSSSPPPALPPLVPVTVAHTVLSVDSGTSRCYRRVGVLTLEARIVLYNAVLDRCSGIDFMDCIKDGAFWEHPLSVQLQAIAQRHQVDVRMVQAIWRHIQSAVHSDDSNNDDNSDTMNLVFVRKPRNTGLAARTASGTSCNSLATSTATASSYRTPTISSAPSPRPPPYHTKISIAHPALRLLRYAKRQQSNEVARAVVSPSDVVLMGKEESAPVPNPMPKTSNKTPQATPKLQLPSPSPSPQQLRKSVCHALLDRCLPNGQLPADATICVARQFGIRPPDIQAIWMGMLATAAATRTLLTAAANVNSGSSSSSSGATVDVATSSDHDNGCTDRTSTSLRETKLDLNLDTAYATMQRIVAIRHKRKTTGAKSMPLASTKNSKSSTASNDAPVVQRARTKTLVIGENAIAGTAVAHNVTLPSSNTNILCSGPPTLQNAVQFLSRKFFDDHQCNEHAFRADARVAMMVNHLHFLRRRRSGGLEHADRCLDTNSFLLQTTVSTNVQNTEKQGEPATRLCLCDAYNLDNVDCRLFSIQPLNDGSVDVLFGTSTATVLCITCRAQGQKRVEYRGVNPTIHNVVRDTPANAKGDDSRMDALPENVVLNSAYLRDAPCSSQALPPSPKRPKLGSVKDDCSYRRVPRELFDEEEWAV